MSEKKGRIGFITPGTEAEDAFNKIKEELSKEKADWNLVNEILQDVTLLILKEELSDLSKVNMDSVILIFLLSCTNFVTAAGVELMEVHERLASIEKAVNTIRLTIK